MLRACQVAQATGNWLSRLSKWKMKVRHQLSGPFRGEVVQLCGRRVHLQRQNVISAVVHGTKRELGAAPRDMPPDDSKLMVRWQQCTHPPLPGGKAFDCVDSMLGERR